MAERVLKIDGPMNESLTGRDKLFINGKEFSMDGVTKVTLTLSTKDIPRLQVEKVLT